jgi:hypothetical protein
MFLDIIFLYTYAIDISDFVPDECNSPAGKLLDDEDGRHSCYQPQSSHNYGGHVFIAQPPRLLPLGKC